MDMKGKGSNDKVIFSTGYPIFSGRSPLNASRDLKGRKYILKEDDSK